MIPTTASLCWCTPDVDQIPKDSSSVAEFPASASQARNGHVWRIHRNSNPGDKVPATDYKHKIEKVKANPMPAASHGSPVSMGGHANGFRHPIGQKHRFANEPLDPIDTY